MAEQEGSASVGTLDDYVAALVNPDWETRSVADVAAYFSVSERTVCRWRAKIDWAWVRDQRRSRYASRMVEIDDAMHRAAKSGDVAAAKLSYERFDGYTPAQAIRLIDCADDELKKRAAELAVSLGTEPKPEESGTGSPLPGTSEAGT